MSYQFTTAEKLQELCSEHGVPISHIARRYEMETSNMTEDEVNHRMDTILLVMHQGIKAATDEKLQSETGLVGGDAYTLQESIEANNVEMIMSDIAVQAMAWSMATNESNACGKCIVACPTAGSAGIVPSSLFAVQKRFDLSHDDIVNGLLNTSAIGLIIEENAMMSGAEGGCQSEDGSAAAMAASAITEMRGGSVEQCLHAASLSLKNILGLVCDPLGGLVEVPCVKRTTFMVMNAFTASDLAMGGVKSAIPFDDVVDAMRRIGEAMPTALRETALGGLATTKTGIRIRKEMAERNRKKKALQAAADSAAADSTD